MIKLCENATDYTLVINENWDNSMLGKRYIFWCLHLFINDLYFSGDLHKYPREK